MEDIPCIDPAILEAHPYADLFPPMDAQEYEEHKASVELNGLQVPVVLFQGKLLLAHLRTFVSFVLFVVKSPGIFPVRRCFFRSRGTRAAARGLLEFPFLFLPQRAQRTQRET